MRYGMKFIEGESRLKLANLWNIKRSRKMEKNNYEYTTSGVNLDRLVEVVRLTIVITILSLVASLIALSMASMR